MARMGGMWCQMRCTDMVVGLEPGEEYASTLLLRGYKNAEYQYVYISYEVKNNIKHEKHLGRVNQSCFGCISAKFRFIVVKLHTLNIYAFRTVEPPHSSSFSCAFETDYFDS